VTADEEEEEVTEGEMVSGVTSMTSYPRKAMPVLECMSATNALVKEAEIHTILNVHSLADEVTPILEQVDNVEVIEETLLKDMESFIFPLMF
jgi:hypothetical protein